MRALVAVLLLATAASVGAGTTSAAPSDSLGLAATATDGSGYAAASTNECDIDGPVTSATAEGRVGEIRVETATELDHLEDPRETAATFATVTRLLSLSDEPQDTAVGVVPPADADYSGRGSADGDYVCLRGEERMLWDGLMAHEYVHTRQDFDLASDMEWFVESSAFYYHAVVPYQRGTISEAAAADRLSEPPRTGQTPDGEPVNGSDVEALTLTEAEDFYPLWSNRGNAVLAALDHEIRTLTDGERTLEHVFRAMNDEHGRISYDDFQDIVADVAGTRLDDWLDRYVDGSTVLEGEQTTPVGLTLTSPAATGDVGILRLDPVPGSNTDDRPDTLALTVDEGEWQRLVVVATNDGAVRATETVRLSVEHSDGGRETLAESSATVLPDELEHVSFTNDSLRELEPGAYDVRVAVADDEVRGTLTVEAREPRGDTASATSRRSDGVASNGDPADSASNPGPVSLLLDAPTDGIAGVLWALLLLSLLGAVVCLFSILSQLRS